MSTLAPPETSTLAPPETSASGAPLQRVVSSQGHETRTIQVPHEKISPEHERWITSLESIALVVVMFLCFGLAAGEVGVTSYELQKHGNSIIRWGRKEMLKHLVGLSLFTALCTMLLAIGSFWAHPFILLVFAFIISHLWVVDAGLLNRASPYRAGNCDRDPNFPAQFRADCSKFVAMEALAWVLWVFLFFTWVWMLYRVVTGLRRRQSRHTVYGH